MWLVASISDRADMKRILYLSNFNLPFPRHAVVFHLETRFLHKVPLRALFRSGSYKWEAMWILPSLIWNSRELLWSFNFLDIFSSLICWCALSSKSFYKIATVPVSTISNGPFPFEWTVIGTACWVGNSHKVVRTHFFHLSDWWEHGEMENFHFRWVCEDRGHTHFYPAIPFLRFIPQQYLNKWTELMQNVSSNTIAHGSIKTTHIGLSARV